MMTLKNNNCKEQLQKKGVNENFLTRNRGETREKSLYFGYLCRLLGFKAAIITYTRSAKFSM